MTTGTTEVTPPSHRTYMRRQAKQLHGAAEAVAIMFDSRRLPRGLQTRRRSAGARCWSRANVERKVGTVYSDRVRSGGSLPPARLDPVQPATACLPT